MEPRRGAQQQQLEQEAIARQLQADGYNASVVASRMIREHGMEEDAATALVSRLFGRKVSARTGDTTTAVMAGLGMAAVGAAGTAVLWWADLGPTYLLFVGMGFVGTGLGKVVTALVNTNAKDDLRERRD